MWTIFDKKRTILGFLVGKENENKTCNITRRDEVEEKCCILRIFISHLGRHPKFCLFFLFGCSPTPLISITLDPLKSEYFSTGAWKFFLSRSFKMVLTDICPHGRSPISLLFSVNLKLLICKKIYTCREEISIIQHSMHTANYLSPIAHLAFPTL